MPITAGVLRSLRKPVTFDYLGETVNISYYPSAFNDTADKAVTHAYTDLEVAIQAEDEAAMNAAALRIAEWFCSVLASWDYLQADGTPEPITPENIVTQMTNFPDFLQTISRNISEDRLQGNANGASSSAPSAATSSRTVRSASRKASRNK